MPKKVLFDTDIGTDIDDAVCLAYLLAQPACELLGITTVSGEANRRARLASALCVAAGKEVPIYPGAEEPLLIAQRQPKAQQADALDAWPHRSEFPEGGAIEFLRNTVRAHPGEITLLAVGPLTNVGLLFRTDPEIPRLLKSLVLMCGQFFGRTPARGPVEWNASCDPHAAAIVYRSAVACHRSHGLDVTQQVRMSANEVRTCVFKHRYSDRWPHSLRSSLRDEAKLLFMTLSPLPRSLTTTFVRLLRETYKLSLRTSQLAGRTHWEADDHRRPPSSGRHS